MNSQPKLLPLWHSVSLKECATRCDWNTPTHVYPDHGGVGIDVFVSNDDLEVEDLKSTNIANFGAKFCALPFLPPNEVESDFDPCLGKLLRRSQKHHKFCSKLQSLKAAMKHYPAVERHVFKAHAEVPELARNGQFEDILLPNYIMDLAETYPKTLSTCLTRWSFTGGCLGTVTCSPGHHLLLHPIGKKLNSLAITPLEEAQKNFKVIDAKENKQVINLNGGRIFQISGIPSFSSLPQDPFCVRQKKVFHYLHMNSLEAESRSYSAESHDLGEELAYVSMSCYIPGEISVATASGKLCLQNAECRKTVWKQSVSLTRDCHSEDFWCCTDFGAHPRSILYSDRQQFTALDLRLKKPKCCDILSLPNPYCLDSEKVMLIKRLFGNDFQHLLSTNMHLFVLDERYPQQPVMSWNHMLESLPLYCDIKPYKFSNSSTELVTLLGSQRSQDIAAFHFSSSSSRVQPFSLSHPLHLSSAKDCFKTLELHCHRVDDDVKTRLSMPLIGLSVIPHCSDAGYTVLQMSSVGDIFYQDFSQCYRKERTFRVGPGCSVLSPDQILPHLSSWMDRTKALNKKPDVGLSKNISIMHVDRSKIFSSFQERCSTRCAICKPQSSAMETETENAICPRCGLHAEYGEKLLESAENLGILSGAFPHPADDGSIINDGDDNNGELACLQLVDFNKTSDPLSRMVLKEWPVEIPTEGNVVDPPCASSQNETSMQYSTPYSEVSIEPTSFEISSAQAFTDEQNNSGFSQELFSTPVGISSQPLKKGRTKKIKLSSSLGF